MISVCSCVIGTSFSSSQRSVNHSLMLPGLPAAATADPANTIASTAATIAAFGM